MFSQYFNGRDYVVVFWYRVLDYVWEYFSNMFIKCEIINFIDWSRKDDVFMVYGFILWRLVKG